MVLKKVHSFFPPPPHRRFCKGGGTKIFKRDMLLAKNFSDILVGGTERLGGRRGEGEEFNILW